MAKSLPGENAVSWPLIALIAAGTIAAAVLFARWWSKPPAVEFDNLRYIQLLRTAVSSERPEMVAKVRQAIDARVSNGAMSSRERLHFEEILKLADAGEWKRANEDCFRFEEAQLNRRRNAPATPHDHQHDHKDGHQH